MTKPTAANIEDLAMLRFSSPEAWPRLHIYERAAAINTIAALYAESVGDEAARQYHSTLAYHFRRDLQQPRDRPR